MITPNYKRKASYNEAVADLKKPIEQLLTDIHEEINTEDRKIEENIAHAQKRFYSLMANVAVNNEKLANRVYVLTFITVIFAIINFIPLVFAFFKWLG